MRHSRLRKKRTTSKYATLFLVVVVIGTVFYFGTASMMGNWVAKNLVSPLLTSLNNVKNPLAEDDTQTTEVTTDKSNEEESKQVTDSLDIQGFTVYGIQMGAFSNEENAITLSEQIQGQKAAGYIIEDKLFRVLATAFKNEDDASTVKEQLKKQNIESQIYPIKVKGLNVEITAGEEKVKEIKDAFLNWTENTAKIGELALDFDRNNMTIKDANQTLGEIAKAIENTKTILDGYAEGNQDNEIYSGLQDLYTEGLKEINGFVEDNYTSTVEFSSKIKYTYIDMIRRYNDYISKITKT